MKNLSKAQLAALQLVREGLIVKAPGSGARYVRADKWLTVNEKTMNVLRDRGLIHVEPMDSLVRDRKVTLTAQGLGTLRGNAGSDD